MPENETTTAPEPAAGEGQGERLVVILIPKAAADLELTHDRTKMSKTDITNRAISLYEFVDAEMREGAELIIRRDGRDYLVKLL